VAAEQVGYFPSQLRYVEVQVDPAG